MQMVVAGGIPALTDSVRTPDADNPRGYFELERVKSLKTDRAWLDDARGRVVKIIHLLLMDLPDDRPYRVLFLARDLREVTASQSAMLARSGKSGATLTADRLAAVYTGQLAQVRTWLAARPQFQVLEVPHAKLISDAVGQAASMNAFLGGDLDERSMAAAVDPSLHRNRSV